jgi:hypothetical protein
MRTWNPWCRVLQKLIFAELVKKFLTFYWAWRFTCSQEPATGPSPEPYKSNSHHYTTINLSNVHFNIILPFVPRSPRCFLPLMFSGQHCICVSPMHAVCSTHLILHSLNTPVIFSEEYKLWGVLLCDVFHSFAFFLLGPNVCLSTLQYHSIAKD